MEEEILPVICSVHFFLKVSSQRAYTPDFRLAQADSIVTEVSSLKYMHIYIHILLVLFFLAEP